VPASAPDAGAATAAPKAMAAARVPRKAAKRKGKAAG
jgi:hypothetical protein